MVICYYLIVDINNCYCFFLMTTSPSTRPVLSTVREVATASIHTILKGKEKGHE